MKAAIILFSPSGNTLNVGKRLKRALERSCIETQMIDISREKEYFLSEKKQDFLKKKIKEHDVLFIGSPVYAHHLQYHVIDMIKSLPETDDVWGKVAVPFVTYGGLSSGISLDEFGQLLKKSGRYVLAGFKVSAPHRMTRGFMDEEFNKDQPENYVEETVLEIVKRIKSDYLQENSAKLRYQGEDVYVRANTVFVEKVCHERMYPKVHIDINKCSQCGKCENVCPVCHIEKAAGGSVRMNNKSDCIHCFNCVVECPCKAIYLEGDLEKAKAFFSNMIAKGKEVPGTSIYPE